MKYTPDRVASICEDIATGQWSITDVAVRNGIDRGTFYDWKNVYPEFALEVAKAEKLRLLSLKEMGLSGLASSLQKTEVVEKVTEYDAQPDPENPGKTKPVIVSQKVVNKQLQPNVTAIIFALTNLDPQNFKHKENMDPTGFGGMEPETGEDWEYNFDLLEPDEQELLEYYLMKCRVQKVPTPEQ